MKKINILGSTGFIGKKTLKILENNFQNYKINFLLANNNYKLLAKQANYFNPSFIGILNDKYYLNIKKIIKNKKIQIVSGLECYEILKMNVNLSILAISGISALKSIESLIKYSDKIDMTLSSPPFRSDGQMKQIL